MSISVIIPAAGIGSRFSSDVKKQFFQISGKPILYYTILSMKQAWDFDKFVIGAGKTDFEYIQSVIKSLDISNIEIVEGGKERSDTVHNCLLCCESSHVLIHDAVRPFAAPDVIKSVINKGIKFDAAICAMPVRDTVKRIENDKVVCSEDRNSLILSHTPQVFQRELVKNALDYVKTNNFTVTDEAQAVELFGKEVYWVKSNAENIKITFAEDKSFLNSLVNKFF